MVIKPVEMTRTSFPVRRVLALPISNLYPYSSSTNGRVGQCYAAMVFRDLSGVSDNGMTVATSPLVFVEAWAGFKLMRSFEVPQGSED